MFSMILGRVGMRRGTCRNGHSWSDRCDPVACSVCGRSQPTAAGPPAQSLRRAA